jgi:hypothetical protein
MPKFKYRLEIDYDQGRACIHLQADALVRALDLLRPEFDDDGDIAPQVEFVPPDRTKGVVTEGVAPAESR